MKDEPVPRSFSEGEYTPAVLSVLLRTSCSPGRSLGGGWSSGAPPLARVRQTGRTTRALRKLLSQFGPHVLVWRWLAQ